METIKIEIPKGYEVGSFDKDSGEIRFKEKPKNIMERIKTVNDVLADHNMTRDQFVRSCEGLEEDEVAYRIIKMLCRSLNQGWEPDWSNSSQYKYFPWFEMRGSSGFRFGDFGSLGYAFVCRLAALLQKQGISRVCRKAI